MNIIFTKHSENRTKTRRILKKEVVEAIKQPDRIFKKYGKYYYIKKLNRGKIEIICEITENNIKIITVYWI